MVRAHPPPPNSPRSPSHGGHPIEVPLLDLRPQYRALKDEIDAALARVLASQRFVLGEEVSGFERALAEYCGVRHAVGCASGSDAVLLALMALGVGPGDQVLCPTYSFFSTAGSVARLGAEPVFVDLEPSTFNPAPASAEAAAEGCTRLRAVLAVDLFGRAADLAALGALAARHGVPLVDDAAQSIGACEAGGRRLGSVAAISCFSFFPTKNLGSYGEGGAVTTDDPELAARVARLRVHGMEPRYVHEEVGLNSRLHALQAAVLRVKLPHLEGWHAARARNAAHYAALFEAAGARDGAVPLAEGGLPLRYPTAPAEPARHVFNQFVIRVPGARRDALREHLATSGVGTEIYYPLPLHRQPCFRHLGTGPLPASEAAARETLAIPIHSDLEEAQRLYVAERILDFLSDA